jgi:hypothetical protein
MAIGVYLLNWKKSRETSLYQLATSVTADGNGTPPGGVPNNGFVLPADVFAASASSGTSILRPGKIKSDSFTSLRNRWRR